MLPAVLHHGVWHDLRGLWLALVAPTQIARRERCLQPPLRVNGGSAPAAGRTARRWGAAGAKAAAGPAGAGLAAENKRLRAELAAARAGAGGNAGEACAPDVDGARHPSIAALAAHARQAESLFGAESEQARLANEALDSAKLRRDAAESPEAAGKRRDARISHKQGVLQRALEREAKLDLQRQAIDTRLDVERQLIDDTRSALKDLGVEVAGGEAESEGPEIAHLLAQVASLRAAAQARQLGARPGPTPGDSAGDADDVLFSDADLEVDEARSMWQVAADAPDYKGKGKGAAVRYDPMSAP